jgi:hypothetical protein
LHHAASCFVFDCHQKLSRRGLAGSWAMRPFVAIDNAFATLFRSTLPARTIMADTTALDPLFQPLALGAIQAPNRILMAPSPVAAPGAMACPRRSWPNTMPARQRRADHFEATGISREGLGWPYAPGLWTAQQVEGWKPVTEALHKAGGRIVAQLWHMGRVAIPISTMASRRSRPRPPRSGPCPHLRRPQGRGRSPPAAPR